MYRKSYFKLSTIAILLIASMVVFGQVNAPKTYPIEDFTKDTAYQVINIIDGDTIKINYKGKLTTVHLMFT